MSIHFSIRLFLSAGLSIGALLGAGCNSDAWWGTGPGADAAVTTPSGIQTGPVTLVYTLTGDTGPTNVSVSFSTNGITFQKATRASGSEGTKNLTVSRIGEEHTFLWDSGVDLPDARASSVFVRVEPENGTPGNTESMALHNKRFLATVENASSGRVRLYSLSTADGVLTFRQSISTGGVDPYDIIFDSGYFFVAHRTSNNIAVLKLDEAAESLSVVQGSPFRGDGAGAKYLAMDDSNHLFVSNGGGGTLTIFDLNTSSGALSLNPNSGASAPGCRSIVVRSSRLYVASETAGEILVFDITSTGELLQNGSSPVTGGGLASPRAMAMFGTRIYAANVGSGTICGFNFQGSGDLSPIGGTPFSVSGSGAEEIVRNGSKLFGVNGSGGNLLALTVDAFGVVGEDTASPLAAGGPSFTVQSAGSVVVAGTTTPKQLRVWVLDAAGALSEASGSPVSAAVEIIRMALSD